MTESRLPTWVIAILGTSLLIIGVLISSHGYAMTDFEDRLLWFIIAAFLVAIAVVLYWLLFIILRRGYPAAMVALSKFLLLPPPAMKPPERPVDKVFVVYGRDVVNRNAMFDFLRSVGLQPMEWSHLLDLAHDGTPHIYDVVSAGLREAKACIVFLTPDDIGHLRQDLLTQEDPEHERHPTPQARANVLFEAGMAMHALKRQTILAELGIIRPFSDMSGRYSIKMKPDERWRHELLRRLESVGCMIDRQGDAWQYSGQFHYGQISGKIIGAMEHSNEAQIQHWNHEPQTAWNSLSHNRL